MASAKVTVTFHGVAESRSVGEVVLAAFGPREIEFVTSHGQLTSDAPRLRCHMCSMFAEDHPTTVCHKFVPPE